MRKTIAVICAITSVLCLAIAFACLSAFALADGFINGVSPDTFENEKWFEPKEDITFSKNDLYVMEKTLDVMPKTFETIIQLDATQVIKGGVIFSNADANAHGAGNYTAKSSNALSLEIDTKGRPKFYYKDDFGNPTTVLFSIDVRGEDFIHLAVTIDEESAHCYLDGELVETQSCVVNDAVSAYPFVVGADYAEARNTYFKGKIRSFAVYSDKRTDAEIAEDMNGADLTDENLLVYYDLEGKSGRVSIKDLSTNGNNLIKKWLFADEIGSNEYDYSMMVLGDTQGMNYYRENLSTIYDYIVANAEVQKVVHVAHLGDICQKSSAAEFTRAKTEYKKLDEAGIRYSVVAGNHDFSSGQSTRWNSVFGENATDGVAYSNQYFSTSNPATALCTAHTFSAGNLDYLLVAISFYATEEDIRWADEIIASHPYHNVIITTHAFRTANGTTSNISSYIQDGDYDWVKGLNKGTEDVDNEIDGLEDLVKRHKNIVLTLNGHHPTRRIEYFETTGDYGNKVVNLVIDPTYFDGKNSYVSHFSGGSGMIASLRFSDGGKKVDVSWYSTVQGKYYNFDSAYRFDIETVERKPVSVSVKGEGGVADYAYTNDAKKPLKITLMPQEGYYVSKLIFDGKNVTKELNDNVYLASDISGNLKFVAEFSKKLFRVSVNSNAAQGLVENVTGVDSVSVGESVRYRIIPKSGWKIESVTFNGQTVGENADGTYSVTVVNGENAVVVAYTQVTVEPQAAQEEITPNGDGTIPAPTESGNGTAALIIASGIGFAVAFGAGIMFIEVKRKGLK